MGYSQSAMSQMISSLENELSIKLVNRFRTGAKLTLEGEELYPYIEQLIYQLLLAIALGTVHIVTIRRAKHIRALLVVH